MYSDFLMSKYDWIVELTNGKKLTGKKEGIFWEDDENSDIVSYGKVKNRKDIKRMGVDNNGIITYAYDKEKPVKFDYWLHMETSLSNDNLSKVYKLESHYDTYLVTKYVRYDNSTFIVDERDWGCILNDNTEILGKDIGKFSNLDITMHNKIKSIFIINNGNKIFAHCDGKNKRFTIANHVYLDLFTHKFYNITSVITEYNKKEKILTVIHDNGRYIIRRLDGNKELIKSY